MIFLICRRIWERMDNLPIIFLLSVVLVALVSVIIKISASLSTLGPPSLEKMFMYSGSPHPQPECKLAMAVLLLRL